MKILVTGVNGFAGRYLVDAAHEREHGVIGSGLEAKADKSVASGLEGYLATDITQRDQVEKLLGETSPDAILHLAGQSSGARSFQDPVNAYEANASGTLYLLEAARQQSFEGPIVVVTSSEAYGRISLGRPVDESSPLRPVSPYGASKAAADAIAQLYFKAYGLSVLRARAFSHTGPGQVPDFVAPSWAEQFARAEAASESGDSGPFVLKVGNLDPVRDLGDVRDIVTAYLDLVERGRAGEAYNVCTERGVKLKDLIEMFQLRARVQLEVQDDPQRVRPTDIPYLVGSSKKIRRELGWKPEKKLEDTVSELLDYWREQVGAKRPAGEHA